MMWFDMDAVRAGRSQAMPGSASSASSASWTPSVLPQLAELAELAAVEEPPSGHASSSVSGNHDDVLGGVEERAEAERGALAAVKHPEAARLLRERWGPAP